MTPLERTCQAVLRTHARSFRWGAFFLPKSMRADACLAYAFCRLVDDTVDEGNDEESSRTQLDLLEAMLLDPGTGNELVAAFVAMCHRTRIGLQPALDLIAGARSDLGCVRVMGDRDFFQYCYRVAGTVGLMMCGILGVSDERARRHAVDLGIAMQITNICRDVLEDAKRGRVYLPQERLRRHGSDQGSLLLATETAQHSKRNEVVVAAAAETVRGLLREADLLYESGQRGMSFIRGRARLAIMVASRLYREIGMVLLEKYGGDPLHGRVFVSMWRKMKLTICSFGAYMKITTEKQLKTLTRASVRG